jgi:hypothetical protein
MQKTVTIQKNKRSTNQSTIQKDLALERTKMFDILYVRNDEDQSVEVVEVSIIDFNTILENLNEGNSVFIAPKKTQLIKSHSKKPCNFISHI